MEKSFTPTQNPETTMAKLLAIHGFPPDPEAYRSHYFSVHVPLVKALPGLVRFEVGEAAATSAGGQRNVMLIAEMHFASVAAAREALASTAGQAAIADISNFADPSNIQIVLFDSAPV
ncbi:MAG: EthD family reductase [Sphingosinicella sp.]|nr:EthD family reductase [Sphingosinicella sp.]